MDAKGEPVTSGMIREELSDLRRDWKEPANVVMHPALKAFIENLGITAASILESTLDSTETPKAYPGTTLAGLPIVERTDMPNTIIEFRDDRDKLIGAIYNLRELEM
jgi:hypothetical protein